jgi:tetratricopeptide (TPR) repeat protein
MPGEAPGRNAPCPCGSGKKYKKCCWDKDSASRVAPLFLPVSSRPIPGVPFEADIDKLSNGVIDAIKAGQYDRAEKLCKRLFREYPELIDGHDRLAMLREAQGRYQEAAQHYTQVLEMIAQHPDDYGSELATIFEERRQQALAKSSPQP